MDSDHLLQTFATLRSRFGDRIEWPEPAPRLNLAARAGDPVRQFKHLHQMCVGHTEHFVQASAVKLLYLIDGYSLVQQSENTLGMYLFARSIVELCAVVVEADRRLLEIAEKPQGSWRPKGEEFFAQIVRLRFGTSDPVARAKLEAVGHPARLLKPLNVMNCIEALRTNPELRALLEAYDRFCDFVHHNLSSNFTASPGFRVDIAARHSSGGAIVLKQPTSVTLYQYPVPTKAQAAAADTGPVVALAAQHTSRVFEEMVRSPFPTEQIVEMTGNAQGMVYLGHVDPTH